MTRIKKSLVILRDEGLISFLQRATRWAKYKTESAVVNSVDPTLNRKELRQSADNIYQFSEEEQISITPWHDVFRVSDFNDISNIPNIKYGFERPFVAEIHDGRILQHNGYCATNNYNIIIDSGKSMNPLGSNVSMDKILEHKLEYIFKNDMRHDIEIAVAFTSAIRPNEPSNFTNYYVWVHNYLTKLEGVNEYVNNTGNNLNILVPADPPSWVLESLGFFGYSDNIVFWDPEEELLAQKLIIPSNRRIERSPDSPHYKFLSPRACKWLREEAISRIDLSNTEFSDKVFISRNDAGRRELRNRTEILDLLRNRGFVSYELSRLAFRQQVELFSQANQIIGVHGAGLVNMLFSTDCDIIELFGDKLIPTYFLLAESCELEYQAISGQSIEDPTLSLHHQDIRVEPDEIADCLDRLNNVSDGNKPE